MLSALPSSTFAVRGNNNNHHRSRRTQIARSRPRLRDRLRAVIQVAAARHGMGIGISALVTLAALRFYSLRLTANECEASGLGRSRSTSSTSPSQSRAPRALIAALSPFCLSQFLRSDQAGLGSLDSGYRGGLEPVEKNDGAATQTQICPVARSLARSSNFSLRATWRTSDFDNGPRGEVSGTALNSTSLFPTIMALFDRKSGMQLIA